MPTLCDNLSVAKEHLRLAQEEASGLHCVVGWYIVGCLSMALSTIEATLITVKEELCGQSGADVSGVDRL